MRSTRRIERGIALALLLAAAAASSVAISGCPEPPDGPRYGGAGSERPQYGGTFVFSHESTVRGFDPHISFDELSGMGIRLLFDGLLDYDADANLVPSLATAMPTISEDGRTFRFELRRGVKFHNGREMTAEDVRWSMERLLHPDVGSPGFTFYTQLDGLDEYRAKEADHIRGVRVIDRYTIEFQLKAPDQTFLNAMAMTFAYPVPRENYEAHPEDVALHPIGTGPFELETWERGVRVVFRKNRDYWQEGKPYVDRMIFLENLTRDVAIMRFRNGDLDVVHRFQPAAYLFFKSARKWQPYMTIEPKVNIWGLVMNCELPPFDNVHVRRAVSYAFDRERWSRARSGRLRPTGQPVPPGLAGYSEDLPGRQYYDLAKAREEMRLAGLPNGYPEEIQLWLGEGSTGRFYGELAQADLAKIGLRVRLKQVAFAVFLQETGKPRTAQMLLTGWNQDFPDAADFLDILFHSRAIHDHDSENKAFYRNPQLDALLDRARVERDRDARRRMYEEASSMIARDAPWAFGWNDMDMQAWQPYVRNYSMHPVWSHEYRFLWLDLPRQRIARQLGGDAALEALGAIVPFGGP